jgi:CBS domain-containing protein
MRVEMQNEKNKKLLITLGMIIIVLIIAVSVVYKISSNARAYEIKQLEEHKTEEKRLAAIERELEESAKRAEEAAVKERLEKLEIINGMEYDTGLTPESTEEEVIAVMHKMTHQKVRAERKIGAIPMVEETINQVNDIVANSSFATKEELLDIVGIWKKGWFHNIDLNHNFLWKQQEGSVGRAYGILSSAEEKEFIRENFPQYVQD